MGIKRSTVGFWYTSKNCRWLISLYYTQSTLVMDRVSYYNCLFINLTLEKFVTGCCVFLGASYCTHINEMCKQQQQQT